MAFLTCLVLFLVFLLLVVLLFRALILFLTFILKMKFKDLELKNEDEK